jgi:hypothetical protein
MSRESTRVDFGQLRLKKKNYYKKSKGHRFDHI